MTRASEKGRIRWDAMPLTPTGYVKTALGALLLAGLAGCGQDQQTFLAERRAASSPLRMPMTALASTEKNGAETTLSGPPKSQKYLVLPSTESLAF